MQRLEGFPLRGALLQAGDAQRRCLGFDAGAQGRGEQFVGQQVRGAVAGNGAAQRVGVVVVEINDEALLRLVLQAKTVADPAHLDALGARVAGEEGVQFSAVLREAVAAQELEEQEARSGHVGLKSVAPVRGARLRRDAGAGNEQCTSCGTARDKIGFWQRISRCGIAYS